MNRKGFTLVELLTVVIILALIALLVVTGVTKLVKNSRENLSDIQLSSLKESASIWAVENTEFLPDDNECIYMTLGYLKNYGFIDEKVIDPKTSNDLSNDLFIKISAELSEYNKLIYNYEISDKEENVKNCKAIEINHLAEENVEAVTTSITGIVPSVDLNGDFLPGSEFSIKVSDEIGELTFFVLSNEGNYVNLIAQKNLASDGTLAGTNQTGDEWYVTTTNSYDNRYGPQTAYEYLNQATSTWTNIPIIESFTYSDIEDQPAGTTHTYGYQGIVTALDSESGNYITTITPLSSDYGEPKIYENMRARLPKYSEVTAPEVGCTTIAGSCVKKSLWLTDYLYPSSYVTGGTSSTSYSPGYWLLSSNSNNSDNAHLVNYDGYVHILNTNIASRGIRPVITVLKSDLLRVMN